MTRSILATLSALPLLALAACYPDPEVEGMDDEPDTAYEESVTSPLPADGEGNAPITQNDTVEGGPDEATDAAHSGDAMMPDAPEQ